MLLSPSNENDAASSQPSGTSGYYSMTNPSELRLNASYAEGAIIADRVAQLSPGALID